MDYKTTFSHACQHCTAVALATERVKRVATRRRFLAKGWEQRIDPRGQALAEMSRNGDVFWGNGGGKTKNDFGFRTGS